MRMKESTGYTVKAFEEFGKKGKLKRLTLATEIPKRQQARQFCRNRRWLYEKFVIIHPNGTIEDFKWTTSS